jgi:hypothetical protein
MRQVLLLSAFGLVLNRAGVDALELPKPTRPLEWKDMNVLSISDSHGQWYYSDSGMLTDNQAGF